VQDTHTHTYVHIYVLCVGSSIKDSTYRKFCLVMTVHLHSWSSGTVVSVNLNCSVPLFLFDIPILFAFTV
jgi:hypothetical protein